MRVDFQKKKKQAHARAWRHGAMIKGKKDKKRKEKKRNEKIIAGTRARLAPRSDDQKGPRDLYKECTHDREFLLHRPFVHARDRTCVRACVRASARNGACACVCVCGCVRVPMTEISAP